MIQEWRVGLDHEGQGAGEAWGEGAGICMWLGEEWQGSL